MNGETEGSSYPPWNEQKGMSSRDTQQRGGVFKALFGVKEARLKEEPPTGFHVYKMYSNLWEEKADWWLPGPSSGRKDRKGAQSFGVMELFVSCHDGFLCVDDCQNASRLTLQMNVAYYIKNVL